MYSFDAQFIQKLQHLCLCRADIVCASGYVNPHFGSKFDIFLWDFLDRLKILTKWLFDIGKYRILLHISDSLLVNNFYVSVNEIFVADVVLLHNVKNREVIFIWAQT